MTLRRAFTVNLLPALALWSFGFALLFLYRFHVPTQEALSSIADLKTRLGFAFSVPAQAFAAGLLPFLFQRLQKGDHRRVTLGALPFFMGVRAFTGATNDVFYALQARWFGDVGTASVVALKTLVDLAIYTPLFVVPLLVWTFALMDNDYSWPRTRATLGRKWIKERAVPIYFGALAVWVPTLAVLYSLPLALQFPFQAVVQCFWGLILVVMTSDEDDGQTA